MILINYSHPFLVSIRPAARGSTGLVRFQSDIICQLCYRCHFLQWYFHLSLSIYGRRFLIFHICSITLHFIDGALCTFILLSCGVLISVFLNDEHGYFFSFYHIFGTLDGAFPLVSSEHLLSDSG